MDYLESLRESFQEYADARLATGQKAYMKNHFEFFGITSPIRRRICQPFLSKENLPSKKEAIAIIKACWKKDQREYQYFAQELAFKYHRQPEKKDIGLFKYMIANKSWWDTVDFIAANLLGHYFKTFPEEIPGTINKWLQSGNIWLQRSCLLFQLKYKKQTDTALLASVIKSLIGSREFFINKAIGWSLREYSKTDPQWVISFVAENELANLSRREALRLCRPS